jgi:hypothetical protein
MNVVDNLNFTIQTLKSFCLFLQLHGVILILSFTPRYTAGSQKNCKLGELGEYMILIGLG